MYDVLVMELLKLGRHAYPYYDTDPGPYMGRGGTSKMEIPKETAPARKFASGATRDSDQHKPDYEGFLSGPVIRQHREYLERTGAIAWAVGLFEGEGCFSHNSNKKEQLVAIIRMTDFDVLQRFQSIVGVGKISGPHKTKQGGGKSPPHCKPHYLWGAYGQNAIKVAVMLYPYLCSRRTARLFEIVGCEAGTGISLGYSPEVIKAFGVFMDKHRVMKDGSMRASDNWKLGIPKNA